MVRTFIIEDEFAPRQMLHDKLTQYFPDILIAGEYENAENALIETLRLRPDLLFLDIQMSGHNGLWLADELMKLKGDTFTPPDIIFTTGYTDSEYLLKAFDLSAIDYLIKPVNLSRLEKAIARYRERAGSTTGLQNMMKVLAGNELLKFKSYNGIFLLRPDDIVYIEADRDYACMFLTNGTKEEVFERLGEIERKLPADSFQRTGKSVIINRKYIRKITDTSLQLATATANYRVELSREVIRLLKKNLP